MRTLIAIVGLVLAGVASAADVVINNGLDCSSPANVIDDSTYLSDYVYVRNVGCGTPDPDSPCPSPGDPTEVCLVDNGEVGGLYVRDSSTITMSGGTVRNEDLIAYDTSTIEMCGGRVDAYLGAKDSATVTMVGGSVGWLGAEEFAILTMSGGTVDDFVAPIDFATVKIVGSDFKVDGVPVPYGDLTAQTGTLSGTLASGQPINNVFYQGGWSESPCSVEDPCSGTITLEWSGPQTMPVPTLNEWGLVTFGILLLTTMAWALRRRRAT